MPDVAKITWDAPENRYYEYGVSKGVHYLQDENGVYNIAAAWNGLINVTDSPSGADSTKLWADGIEYATLRAGEQYGCSIEAYTYPDQFAECDGTVSLAPGVTIGQQKRKPFGLCWRTEVGSAKEGEEAGYKLHLAYGLTVSPSEQAHDTVNDSVDAATFSWDAEGSPVNVTGYKPTAKLVIDSRKVASAKLTTLENILYGDGTNAPKLPTPDEVLDTVK